jgi:hypothetical protein
LKERGVLGHAAAPSRRKLAGGTDGIVELPGGSAQVGPYQHGLPLADVDGLSAIAPRRAPVRAAERRAIHVSGYDREGRDFYATPDWVTKALLQHVSFRGPIWEPCCGDGAMSTVLAAYRYKVVSTDIAERGFGTSGIDFLTCRTVPGGCRSIVTNPPYGDTGSHKGQGRRMKSPGRCVRPALTDSFAFPAA